jgi:hypothetical protein
MVAYVIPREIRGMLMRLYTLLDDFPLLAIFVATVAIILLSFECGFRAGRWRSGRPNHEQEVVVRSEVGGMLGLVTFILAIMFWIAAAHFDATRQALLNEANVIKTVYLRADLLSEPHRAEIRNLLREYVDIRLEAFRSGKIDQAIARSEELHSRLWLQATASRETTPNAVFAVQFIQSLNELMAIHTRRVIVGMEFRIPNIIWIVLYVITALTAASIGCHAGLTGARKPLVAIALVLIFSVVILLIADLDNPRRGALKVSQQALIDLRRTMSDPNR